MRTWAKTLRRQDAAVHLCWDFTPRTACGLAVESQAQPLVEWVVPESLWTGPLGIAEVTCRNCLATVQSQDTERS